MSKPIQLQYNLSVSTIQKKEFISFYAGIRE